MVDTGLIHRFKKKNCALSKLIRQSQHGVRCSDNDCGLMVNCAPSKLVRKSHQCVRCSDNDRGLMVTWIILEEINLVNV